MLMFLVIVSTKDGSFDPFWTSLDARFPLVSIPLPFKSSSVPSVLPALPLLGFSRCHQVFLEQVKHDRGNYQDTIPTRTPHPSEKNERHTAINSHFVILKTPLTRSTENVNSYSTFNRLTVFSYG